jgi:hypothetical protein
MIKKSDLPVKACVTCGFEMVWRKKWQKVWDEVKYCSDRCRQQSKQGSQTKPPAMRKN